MMAPLDFCNEARLEFSSPKELRLEFLRDCAEWLLMLQLLLFPLPRRDE